MKERVFFPFFLFSHLVFAISFPVFSFPKKKTREKNRDGEQECTREKLAFSGAFSSAVPFCFLSFFSRSRVFLFFFLTFFFAKQKIRQAIGFPFRKAALLSLFPNEREAVRG